MRGFMFTVHIFMDFIFINILFVEKRLIACDKATYRSIKPVNSKHFSLNRLLKYTKLNNQMYKKQHNNSNKQYNKMTIILDHAKKTAHRQFKDVYRLGKIKILSIKK